MKADADFLADWQRSHGAAWLVGRWLSDQGLEVKVPVPQLRPDAEQRHAFRDGGDLHVVRTIEVKHRRIPFTRRDDYPYATVFIDESYKVTPERLTKLWFYAILNEARTHVCLIHTDTKHTWTTQRRWDEAQGRECEFTVCPTVLATFHAL